MEPVAEALFADLLFELFDAAEFYVRGTLRFCWLYARAKIFLKEHFEVGVNFVV